MNVTTKSLIAISCAFIVTAISAEPFRSFTSTDGKTVRARVINYDNSSDKVKLEKEGGGSFSVPVSAFSVDDQIIIRNWELVKGFLSENGMKVSFKRTDLRKQESDTEGDSVHVIHQWLNYTITIENNTGRTLNNIRIETCPHFSLTNTDQHDPESIVRYVARGEGMEEFPIDSIPPRKTIEISTKEFGEESISGGILVNGKECSQKSIVSGIWIRLFLKLPDGNEVMREIKDPTSIWDGFTWTLEGPRNPELSPPD